MFAPNRVSLSLRAATGIALVGISGLILACSPPPRDDAAVRAEVREALDRYTAAARAVDPVASSAAFAPNGVLFEPGIKPIVSPDSIRAFIASFPGVIVDSATATADTIEVHGDTAYVWGTFFEKLRFQGQPPSAQRGHFVMEWSRQKNGRWLIERYYRVPLPG